MNLRKAKNYSIGLDLGTGSVGWAVVDEDGELYQIKGKPTWGSRLFRSAETAASTRVKRGQRRRYARRRQRIDELQRIFAPDIEKVDKDFFIRLKQARLLLEDKDSKIQDYRWPLFNDPSFTESDYYSLYPTIYHLREHLCEADSKEDIRLVYLALHNIVKYRGNFLHEDEGSALTASNANASQSAQELIEALEEYLTTAYEETSLASPDAKELASALDDKSMRNADRAEAILNALSPNDKLAKDICKQIGRACVGYKVDYIKIFAGIDEAQDTNFSLKDEEKPQAFLDEICPDDGVRLFESVQSAYSAFVLSGILQGAQSISKAMVRTYEKHQKDLKTLKGLFKDYLSREEYNEFFRGVLDERGNYDINELRPGTYTSYIAGDGKANRKGTTHESLLKRINEICDSNSKILEDKRYRAIEARLKAGEESDFLLKLKTRSNGAIPYQIHLEEAVAIIERQGKYYPFLLENKELIKKIIGSRIPYYVGPLTFAPDPDGKYPNNPIDPSRKFAWAVRKEGTEGRKVFPWNVEEIVDTDETASRFIRRMTGTCTYLYGCDVLPRHSLLYEEFCVLNELNGSRWCNRGGVPQRFDHMDKLAIFENLFMNLKNTSVSYAKVQDWLKENGMGATDPVVSGGQGETGYESKLTSHHDFCKILGVQSLDDAPLSITEMEEIILWNTVFEDRAIFKRKLNSKYGPEGDGRLSANQIKQLVAKRYTGWGNLSREFLTGLRVEAPIATKSVSIMDVLRNGNPFSNYDQVVLMEALRDRNLDFQGKVDERNKQYFEETGNKLSVDDMQGSPANRRTVIQAMRIIEEIVRITKCEPARICIEVTRDDDWGKKGSRTRSRYNQLNDALKAFKADKELINELRDKQSELDDDRLLLYFEQQGKCMYSEEPLDINALQTYQIDHIIPQAYIKDDSLSNRVLVKSGYNQRKLDSLLLDKKLIDNRKSWWKSLKDAGVISQKKYANLTCEKISERQLSGFINRQLVETSQIVKFVRQLCEQKYPNTDVISIKANTAHGVRDNLGLVKCRDLNNYHHAHDAFLACQVGEFISKIYPQWKDGFTLERIRSYIKNLTGDNKTTRVPGKSGFIADSMTHLDSVDKVTGEQWLHEERNEYIRKVFNYPSCFISRMQEMQTGAFWDETVYSPRDIKNGKNLGIPLKSSKKESNFEGVLAPSKYGGVSSVKQAYWFIFAAKDKNDEWKFFFEGVPIYLAGQIGGALWDYAESIANAAKCHGAVILRSCVPLSTTLVLEGTRYYLGGRSGASNYLYPAEELVGTMEVAAAINDLFDNEASPSEESLSLVYEWCSSALARKIPRNQDVIEKVRAGRERYEQLSHEDKRSFLRGLMSKLNRKAKTVDISYFVGAKQAGSPLYNLTNLLPSITWIDQSVTGIFETRTTFEDLCRGL